MRRSALVVAGFFACVYVGFLVAALLSGAMALPPKPALINPYPILATVAAFSLLASAARGGGDR